MAIKKKVNGTWQSINPKQLKGIPYTGTLPAVLTGTKAGYLHHYKIYGNLTQNGTPTPSDPIYPSECGERTENLFDESTLQNGYYGNDNSSYNVFVTDDRYRSFTLDLIAGTYTLNITCDVSIKLLRVNNSVDGAVPVGTDDRQYTFTLTGDATIYVTFRNQAATNNYPNLNVMLNTGSTPPSTYIPYGYKLPLLSGSTPVDIYIGESQTTRRIKKLVIDGTESWGNPHGQSLFGVMNFMDNAPFIAGISAYSTHFNYNPVQSGIDQATSNGEFVLQKTGSNHFNVFFKMTAFTSTDDFKAWLASQYANGTPVTIWYVLATEETGTINEPLRKIGNYADTVDSTQTAAQIPTTANSTTISWGGQGLAPSQFDSIQEWVDTPTYKRVNGEWVADNSN